jgi:hypothetical protein
MILYLRSFTRLLSSWGSDLWVNARRAFVGGTGRHIAGLVGGD